MNAVNAETIRKAVDYYCRTFGTGAEEFDLATSIAESEVLKAAALAYASLLDGTHPEMMLVHRNAASIELAHNAWFDVELNTASIADKPVGRYVWTGDAPEVGVEGDGE